jgi:hypothetical protein
MILMLNAAAAAAAAATDTGNSPPLCVLLESFHLLLPQLSL